MEDILETAKGRFRDAQEYWTDIYKKAEEDLYFLSDEPNAQWNANDANNRLKNGRPVVTLDQLSPFVNQVVNDAKRSTPSIDIIPSDEGDEDTAKIIKEKIREIQYRSSSDLAYDTAITYAVKSGFGFIEMEHDYVEGSVFEQEIEISPVHDPLCVLMDPSAKDITFKDAEYCFVVFDAPKEVVEKEYGEDITSFSNEIYAQKKDCVILCKYYYIENKKVEYGITSDGVMEKVREGVAYEVTRSTTEPVVWKCILSDDKILKKVRYIGKHIPIVGVVGSQYYIKGKRYIESLIRKAKEPQRLFNYWKSLETELLQRQPRANYIMRVGQVAGFEDLWENPDQAPYLEYHGKDAEGNPADMPIRQEPPVIATGITQAAQTASDSIMKTIGLFNTSLGMESQEVSGVAIQRKNSEGDTAVYHFHDNLAKSIARLGKIILDAIPDIYDIPRVIKALDEEDNVKFIGINGMIAGKEKSTYDLTKLNYDVRIVTGISYTTKRQESNEFFSTVVANNPDLIKVMGDLMFKYSDMAGADTMAERMRKFVDPMYLETDEEQEFDPEKAQMQQVIEQGQALIEQLKGENALIAQQLYDRKRELDIKEMSEQNKRQADIEDANLELEKIRLENNKLISEFEFKMAALNLKQKELDVKKEEATISTAIDIEKMRQEENARLKEISSDLKRVMGKNDEGEDKGDKERINGA